MGGWRLALPNASTVGSWSMLKTCETLRITESRTLSEGLELHVQALPPRSEDTGGLIRELIEWDNELQGRGGRNKLEKGGNVFGARKNNSELGVVDAEARVSHAQGHNSGLRHTCILKTSAFRCMLGWGARHTDRVLAKRVVQADTNLVVGLAGNIDQLPFYVDISISETLKEG